MLKNDNQPDIKLVKVYESLNLSIAWIAIKLVASLFVVLMGGDYNAEGREGCGPVATLKAVCAI